MTLLDVVDNVLSEQDAGRGTCLALLDFSRAFDCISLAWFRSYLGDRSQRVKIRKEDGKLILSDLKPRNRGVPQGPILGPLLFIVYGADLVKNIKYCKYHADDVQLYISAKPENVDEAISNINEDLDSVARPYKRSGSKFLIFLLVTVKVCNKNIARVEEAKNWEFSSIANFVSKNMLLT